MWRQPFAQCLRPITPLIRTSLEVHLVFSKAHQSWTSQRQNKRNQLSSMRNTQSPKKKRLHHPVPIEDKRDLRHWSWIATLLPVKCLEFCSSSGISGRVPGDHTMPAGSRIYPKVNDEEADYKQGSSRTVGCDPMTERETSSCCGRDNQAS